MVAARAGSSKTWSRVLAALLLLALGGAIWRWAGHGPQPLGESRPGSGLEGTEDGLSKTARAGAKIGTRAGARASQPGSPGRAKGRLAGRALSTDPVIKPLTVVGGQPVYPDLSVHQPQTRIERNAPPEESLEGVLIFDRGQQAWLALPLKHQPGEPLFLRIYDRDFAERFALDATAPQAASSDLSWDGKDAQGQALAPGRYSLKAWSSLQAVVREVIVR